MRARILSFYLPLGLLSLVLSALDGVAEFRCSADISYTWVKRPSVATGHQGLVGGGPVGGGPVGGGPVGGATTHSPGQAPTQVPPTPTPEPTIVRLLGLERSGADEVGARAALQMETDRQRIRASEACKREHEAFGTCVALKMSARATVLNSLSFSARSELERALAEECRQQEGTCLGVEVSEPKCREIVAAKPSASPEPEKPGDAKGAKQPPKDGKKK